MPSGIKKVYRGIQLDNDVCIITNAGTPTDGAAGTGAGRCGPGSLCIDFTNSVLYTNVNTKASPLWVAVSTQST